MQEVTFMLHRLLYVAPSLPQTGSYSKVHDLKRWNDLWDISVCT